MQWQSQVHIGSSLYAYIQKHTDCWLQPVIQAELFFFSYSCSPLAWYLLYEFVSMGSSLCKLSKGSIQEGKSTNQSQNTMVATSPLTPAVMATKGDKLVLHKASGYNWFSALRTTSWGMRKNYSCSFSGMHSVGVHTEGFVGWDALIFNEAAFLYA